MVELEQIREITLQNLPTCLGLERVHLSLPVEGKSTAFLAHITVRRIKEEAEPEGWQARIKGLLQEKWKPRELNVEILKVAARAGGRGGPGAPGGPRG